jgi:hypothetical protein
MSNRLYKESFTAPVTKRDGASGTTARLAAHLANGLGSIS